MQRIHLRAAASAAGALGRVGMDVVVKLDDGREIQSKLKELPWPLGSGHYVAKVEGISGCYDCARIRPGTLPKVPKCDRKGQSQFCNGVDVREVIVRPAWNAPKDAPGTRAFWCNGCRSMHHGGYRFPRKGEA